MRTATPTSSRIVDPRPTVTKLMHTTRLRRPAKVAATPAPRTRLEPQKHTPYQEAVKPITPDAVVCGIALLLALGCGGTQSTPSAPGSTTGVAPPPDAGTGVVATVPDAVAMLLVNALSSELCPRLSGSFVGLPAESALTGAASGTVASIGRLWLRQCQVDHSGPLLRLRIGGPGWMWIDREADGFRIRQYVLFESSIELQANLTVGFDPVTRIATVWMRPAETGAATALRSVGQVTPQATTFFSELLGGLAGISGQGVNERASAEISRIGSQMMLERLQTGLTVTYSLTTRQIDFTLGELAVGEVPERPFRSNEYAEGSWEVNQRSRIWPGGIDVIGQLPESSSPRKITIDVEEGAGVAVRHVCADTFAREMDLFLRGDAGARREAAGTLVGEYRELHRAIDVHVPAQDCTSLLLLVPLPPRTAPAPGSPPAATQARLLVRQVSASALPHLTRTNPSVRIRLRSLQVRDRDSEDSAWDALGGAADPFVVIGSVPRSAEIARTRVLTDRHQGTYDLWLPGAYQMDSDLPLRFVVYDEDSMDNDEMGTGELRSDEANAALAAPNHTVRVAIRAAGSTAVQIGTLELELESLR